MDRSIITPIPDRMDMAAVAQAQFYKTGNAVEVGVWKGEFAKHNLEHWMGRYFMVDPWQPRNDGSIDKNMQDIESWADIFNDAMSNTYEHHDRCVNKIMDSLEAATHMKDGLFDWIYIDANHTYNGVASDLNAWWPKLRPGGLFSGDDYGNQSDRWAAKYGEYGKVYKWGVIEAVNEFAATHGLQVHVTWMNDKTECPSWYIVKH